MLVRTMQLDASRALHPRGRSHKKQVLHTQRPSLGWASWTWRQQGKDSLSPQSDERAPGLVPICHFTNEALSPEPGLQTGCNSISPTGKGHGCRISVLGQRRDRLTVSLALQT